MVVLLHSARLAVHRVPALLVALALASHAPAQKRTAVQPAAVQAPAGPAAVQPLHPSIQALKDLYARDPQQYYTTLYGGAGVPKLGGDDVPSRLIPSPLPPYPLPAVAPDAAFWQRLSRIAQGRPAGRHAGVRPGRGQVITSTGFVRDPADFRGANFLPPHAAEFLGVFAPENPAARLEALKDTGVYISQLAHAGINVVRIFYGYQSWRHGQIDANAIQLDEILTMLDANRMSAIITMGNSFGRKSTVLITESFPSRIYDGGGHMPSALWKMITAEHKPWLIDTGFFQTPGGELVQQYGVGGNVPFQTFLDGEWTSYCNHIAALAVAHPSLMGCEYWNEPEGASGIPIFARMGQLIHRAATIMTDRTDVVRFMEASSPLAIAGFARDWLDPLVGGRSWLSEFVDGYGFHTTVVMNYQSLPYTPGGGQKATPGYPPRDTYETQALRSRASVVGVVETVHAFLEEYQGVNGFLNELCIRGFMPQLLGDVDLACRDRNPTGNGPWPSTLGRMYWLAGASPFNAFTMMLADGTPWHPQDLASLQDRLTVPGANHVEAQIRSALPGLDLGAARIHAPTAIRLSNLTRPLVLEGGSTTLLVFADPLNDVPTHSQFNAYPVTVRPAERFKIWVRAVRKVGLTYTVSPITDLSSLAGVGSLGSLSGDLMLRDIDDNRDPSCYSNPLPLRLSLYTSATTLPTWLDVGGGLATYPVGNVGLDATWGGIGVTTPSCTPAARIHTLFNPCSFPEYAATAGMAPVLPSVEREIMLRAQLAGRIRQQYAGLSGNLSGAFRITESGADKFVLAYSRLVRKSLNSTEHYGPGEDARVNGDPTLAWSANYGDYFRNDPSTGEPLKREVVIVDLAVAAGPAITGSAAVLPSRGLDNGAEASPGAEAIDPQVACTPDGDTVVIARVAQDPYFEFISPGLHGASLDYTSGGGPLTVNGGAEPSNCTPPTQPAYLPIPYDNAGTRWPGATPHKKENFTAFHAGSQWRVYPWETHAWVRHATATTTWVADQVRLGEPMFPIGNFRTENWSLLQTDLHDVQRRDSLLRAGYSASLSLAFNHGWDVTPPPTMDISDPHTWHANTRPQVSVGPRVGNAITVLATWNQFPQALRSNFQLPRTTLPNPAYEARSLRFTVNVNTGTPTFLPGYETFGTSLLRTSGPAPNRVGLSVRGAVAAILRPKPLGGGNFDDSGSSRAFFQLGQSIYVCDEGGAPFLLDPGQGIVPRFRPPKAAVHLVRVTLPGAIPPPASTPELAAWLSPETTAGSANQRIAYSWSLPQAGLSNLTDVADVTATYRTQDPTAEIVAVLPLVGTNGAGWPVGRIVWKADGDVRWADVAYQAATPAVLARASSATGEGPFYCHRTDVSAAPGALVYTHDGTVIAFRP